MTWFKDNIAYLIAILVVLTWVAITFILVSGLHNGKSGDLPTLLAIYSTVTGSFTSILSYWFGTTKSSKDKDTIITNLSK